MLFGSLGHRTNAGILCALVLLAFPRLVLSEAPLASGLLREVAELGVLASDSSVTSHARERERDSVTMCGHCLGGIIGRLCLETVQLLLCCIAAHLHCCPFFSGRFGGAKCVFLIPDTPWDCHIYIYAYQWTPLAPPNVGIDRIHAECLRVIRPSGPEPTDRV